MSVINFVADTARKHIDATMMAPSAAQRVLDMQANESCSVEAVAEELAWQGYSRDVGGLAPADRNHVRYAACHAVRMQSRCWRDAAHQQAVTDAVAWMKTEGGTTFRNLPDEKLRALATLFASVVMTSYFGVTENTRPLAPGAYLKIVEGK